jgi:hypothetical protein
MKGACCTLSIRCLRGVVALYPLLPNVLFRHPALCGVRLSKYSSTFVFERSAQDTPRTVRYRSTDRKQILEHVRGDLRERSDSHCSEVYLRIVKRDTSGADVRAALYEMLKRDEVKIKEGKWRLVALVQQRRAS